MKLQQGKPPKNAKRIYRWDDLPKAETAATYLVESEGQEPHTTIVSGKRRRVLEGLLKSPLYAASYARIGDHVDHLRKDNGIDIDTLGYKNDVETGREKFGVYSLRSKVTWINPNQSGVAA